MSQFHYGDSVAKVTDASCVSGMLLRSYGGHYFFRVYHEDKSFTDYDLCHDDLEVTIAADALAAFYDLGEEKRLDHSPQVLGLKQVAEINSADKMDGQ